MNNNPKRKNKKKHIKKAKNILQTTKKSKEEQKEQQLLHEGMIDLVSLSGQEVLSKPIEEEENQGMVQENYQQKGSKWARLPPCVDGKEELMIIGSKNTGKSTLCEHLLTSQPEHYVLLDCDIGKNSCLEGSVSLKTHSFSKKIWIGEFTPLNNLQTYLRVITYLYRYYRQTFFSKKLLINTMGYITGLGELLLYHIFQIIKPKSILILGSQPKLSDNDILFKITSKIRDGSYISKLYLNKSEQKEYPTSTNLFYYQNKNAVSKHKTNRFQRYFERDEQKINNLCDLLQRIRVARSPYKVPKLFYKERKDVEIFQQTKHQKEESQGQQTVLYRCLDQEQSVDMRLVILGNMVREDKVNTSQQNMSGLFEVETLGFCFNKYIYSSQSMQGLCGIVTEGVDFQKGFYHLTQNQLIDLQLKMGRIHYLMVITKGLGSKGIRNNPSKTS